ncbi:exonuclease RecJ, partial [Halorubrum sp. SS7]
GGRAAGDATGEPTDLGDACRAAAGEVGGDGWGTPERGGVSVATDANDPGDADVTAALAALREAI